jgi:hypothetical protein
MLGKRKDAHTTTGFSEQRTTATAEPLGMAATAENGIAREQPAETAEPLTLGTSCACGHARRDHRGLRIEVTGPCLECDCEEFAREAVPSESSELEAAESSEQTMARIRSALERVERMQQTIAALRARAGSGPQDDEAASVQCPESKIR